MLKGAFWTMSALAVAVTYLAYRRGGRLCHCLGPVAGFIAHTFFSKVA